MYEYIHSLTITIKALLCNSYSKCILCCQKAQKSVKTFEIVVMETSG